MTKKKLSYDKRKKDDQISFFDESALSGGTGTVLTDLPMDWENVFQNDERTQGVHTDSVSDALILSLTTLGTVDIEYMSAVTGADYKTVIGSLRGAIYQNPETWGGCFYKGWETADEYLSGNLIRKLNAATEANQRYPGKFDDNIAAIQRVLPDAVPTKDIYVTLGSPWVPTDIIDSFITYILNLRRAPFSGTRHDEITGSWEIPCKSFYRSGVRSESTYGTVRISALDILERTLNMRAVSVTDEIFSFMTKTGKKRVVNQSETVAALEKQAKLIQTFQEWVWQDPARKKRLETIFENKYSCIRRRVFDGSFLEFPQMSPAVQLYPYQKDAVARILFTDNTLLAHDVGSGKTYVMVAAGMELLRMGLSKKNMYVVPNNIVGQWREIFTSMYPSAKVLCIEPKNFTPDKRGAVLKEIRDGTYDGIVMAYSCFERIGVSKRRRIEELEEEREQVRALLKKQNKATVQLEKKLSKIQKELSELALAWYKRDDNVYFDELGVTRLFVDEAHNFKNVPVDTKIYNVLGINASGSKKCQDMLDKVRTVQKQNGGKGVVLATGTPITNSITDVFVLQHYLQSGQLALLDLQSFDSWVGMFAERRTEFEIDVDTNSYRLATRFSQFHNLPELTALLSLFADFHGVDVSAGIPETDGYDDALVPKTLPLTEYLKNISKRADAVRGGRVKPKDDNMLKITTDGRKAALDLRLVDESASFTYLSKVAQCVENVVRIYLQTKENKSTQLIFCDSSTPKAGFNLYDEVKRLLLAEGIPEGEIAFVHDANTEARREKLFARMRRGDIRILLGSTFKLGLGVNVQDRLIALHHLDVPWRPADMTQREGRILRQGNQNEKVRIFRYITEGSFDAYSWQLLETKARFIADLLSGSYSERSGGDVSDVVLDYAEVKALAVGNPLVKERVETANELARYSTLQHKLIEMRIHLEKKLLQLPARRVRQRQLIENCQADLEAYATWVRENPEPMDLIGRKEEAESRKALRERIQQALLDNVLESKERTLLTYKGFDVILPANMLLDRPYVYLQRNGRYYVELGASELGNLQRIDNFLSGLEEHLNKLREGLLSLRKEEADLRLELSKDESYTEAIEACKKKLQEIDKKLGATKK